MPANLYEQQAANRRNTWAVMALFVVLLFLLGYGVDRFYLGVSYPIAGGVALVAGLVSAVSGYFRGDKAVLASAGAVPLEQLDLEGAPPEARFKLRQYENVVEEMSLASGLPRPRLYVIPDEDPNAFATGRDPERAAIAVTKGLLESLSRDELQGVVAHELSHVRNFDIRLMTVVAALVGAILMLSDWSMRIAQFGGGGKKSRSKGGGGGGLGPIVFVVWIAAVILAPLIGQLLAMLVSRNREYLADASAAEMTRNPMALAGALDKLDAAAEPTHSIKRATAALCIVDPLARPIGKKEGRWANLMASHPPIDRRVEALRGMSYVGPAR
jgi:heat shock protein HtpX